MHRFLLHIFNVIDYWIEMQWDTAKKYGLCQLLVIVFSDMQLSISM